MKRTLLIAALFATVVAAQPAQARKACEELKQEIASKIDAKGVKQYSLDIVAPDAVGERRVVGSCDGGTQRIVYLRAEVPGNASATAAATAVVQTSGS